MTILDYQYRRYGINHSRPSPVSLCLGTLGLPPSKLGPPQPARRVAFQILPRTLHQSFHFLTNFGRHASVAHLGSVSLSTYSLQTGPFHVRTFCASWLSLTAHHTFMRLLSSPEVEASDNPYSETGPNRCTQHHLPSRGKRLDCYPSRSRRY